MHSSNTGTPQEQVIDDKIKKPSLLTCIRDMATTLIFLPR
ncbi:hypothetical protein HMPREF1565_1253 [Providencia alcalifaciens RIMD 1656011]|nr:hypothetical protein HMPREF1565_1253 [Providencia alcalifaciens RIMD 1656011]